MDASVHTAGTACTMTGAWIGVSSGPPDASAPAMASGGSDWTLPEAVYFSEWGGRRSALISRVWTIKG